MRRSSQKGQRDFSRARPDNRHSNRRALTTPSSPRPSDRFIVAAFIFSVLGPGTLGRAVEALPLDNRWFFRLLGPEPEELLALGKAIASRASVNADPPF